MRSGHCDAGFDLRACAMTAPSAVFGWAIEIAGYANTCCIRSDGYEEDVYALALRLLTKAYAAGQRAQAEKDAEIAGQYAEAMSGSIETHLAYQASVTIAAAIRAAAPKEEE